MNISMKLVYQYMEIFFPFSPTSNLLYSLQVENCDSNSRLVVDEDDNGKLRLEGVNYGGLLLKSLYGIMLSNTVCKEMVMSIKKIACVSVAPDLRF